MSQDRAHNWQAANGGKRALGKHAGYQYAEEIAGYDSSDYDIEAMRTDARHGNFSPERAEDYRHTAIVAASLMNGQFTQARQQCRSYGLDYAEQRAAAGLNPWPA